MAAAYATRPGSRFPPGATALPDGVNFCVFSRHATRVELLLYAEADSPEPFQVIALAPEQNRTFFFWHVFVEGLAARGPATPGASTGRPTRSRRAGASTRARSSPTRGREP